MFLGNPQARWLEDIDGAGGEQGYDRERDQRLKHGAEFCPARKHGGIGGRKSGAGVKGQE